MRRRVPVVTCLGCGIDFVPLFISQTRCLGCEMNGNVKGIFKAKIEEEKMGDVGKVERTGTGIVVVLKSGSPEMTVDRIDGDIAECVWFDPLSDGSFGGINRASFRLVGLCLA